MINFIKNNKPYTRWWWFSNKFSKEEYDKKKSKGYIDVFYNPKFLNFSISLSSLETNSPMVLMPAA